ncbi:UDP-glycosyltransferase 83A1-like protein [Tanacetum coccineum]
MKSNHVLVVPYPAQGHVIPLMDAARAHRKDYCMGWISKVAQKMGIRLAVFCSGSAAVMAVFMSVQKLLDDQVIDRNGVPVKDQMVQLSTNMPPMDPKQFLWACIGDPVTNKKMFALGLEGTVAAGAADCIICNSAMELEPETFTLFPKILPIGPLLVNNEKTKQAGHFWNEDSSCVTWLDQQPFCSVIYVAFGSLAILNQHQFEELALGLDLINRPFLWVVRPGLSGSTDHIYPNGFMDRIGTRGKIVSWAPQQEVLNHPSVACFMSHCGWNSTMEGVSNGVPFLCWPYFYDQFLDATYICDFWKTGLGLNKDDTGIVTREEIKSKVEQLFRNDKIKQNALNLKERVMGSVKEGNSSSKNLSNFVDWDFLNAEIQRLSGETSTSIVPNHTNNLRMSRMAKIEFPKFYGDDPTAWHEQCSRIHEENVAWEVYVEALLKRFCSTYEDPMSDLKNIRQKEVYRSDLHILMLIDLLKTKVECLTHKAISFFWGGLANEVMKSVRMFRPQTLTDAYCLSKLQEANNNVSKKFTKSLLPTPRYNQPYTGTFVKNQVPQVSSVNQSFNKNKRVYNNAPQRKQLTQKELDDKRAKNQCFYYDQRYVPRHKCSGRLFSLEMVEDSRYYEDETKVYDHLIMSAFVFGDEYSICSRVVIMERNGVLHAMLRQLDDFVLSVYGKRITLEIRGLLAGIHGLFSGRNCFLVRRITCGYPWPELEGKRIWYDPRAIDVIYLVFEWLIGLTCMYCVWHGKVVLEVIFVDTRIAIIGLLVCSVVCLDLSYRLSFASLHRILIVWIPDVPIRRHRCSLIPLSRGSFDVIVGMDWLSKRKFVIVCHEKVVRIPLEGDEILQVRVIDRFGSRKSTAVAKFHMSKPPRTERIFEELQRSMEFLKVSVELLRKEKLYAKFTKSESDIRTMILATPTNVVGNALSRKERVKSRRVRGMILAAQSSISRSEMDEAHASRQSEHAIRTLESMLRACVIDYGGRWGVHLPLAELSYNNSYHSSIQYALFEALYGRKCRSHVLWQRFEKVSPWKGVICFGKKGKLAPRYVEPFEILERIGSIAYRLRLPEELSSVRDTFHVSNLERKKYLADANLHVPLDDIKVDNTLRGLLASIHGLFSGRNCCLVRRITYGYPWLELEGKRIWYDPRSIEVACQGTSSVGYEGSDSQEDYIRSRCTTTSARQTTAAKKANLTHGRQRGGSSASTQFGELMEQELRLKREAAERAFEAQAEKDRTLMRLEELRFLATSTKDLDEDDAYWIKKQKKIDQKQNEK